MKLKHLQAIAIVLLLLVGATAAFAANDPGHDTLYVLRLGDTNITGSINLTNNLTASGIRYATLLYGNQLNIRANGTVIDPDTDNIPAMQATASNLYLDANTILLGTLKANPLIQIGGAANDATLNVSGTIMQSGVLLCLANGTNCINGNNTGNVSSITAGNGISIDRGTGDVTVSTSATTCGAGNYSYWDGNSWECRADQNSGGSGNITGAGTNGKIAKFTAAGTIGNSIMTESGATVTVNGNLATGNLTTTGNINTPTNFYIGNGASATGSSATAIGGGATANGNSSITIGFGTVNANYGVAIGDNVSVAHANSIALGRNARTSAANQLMVGNNSQNLNTYIYGNLNVSSGNDICITGGNCLSSITGGDGTGGWTNTSTATSTSLDVNIGSTTLYVNSTSGNIGIGTTAGAGKLTVIKASTYNSEGTAGLYIKSNTSNGNAGLILGADNASTLAYIQAISIGSSYNYDLALNPNNGNVGINTIAPKQKLDVNGSINVSGTGATIYINNTNVCLSDGTNCPAGTTYTNGTGITLTGSQFNLSTSYTDARYLGISATAANSNQLGGQTTTYYLNTTTAFDNTSTSDVDVSGNSSNLNLQIGAGKVGAAEVANDAIDGAQLADTVALDANLAFSSYNVSFTNITVADDITAQSFITNYVSGATGFRVIEYPRDAYYQNRTGDVAGAIKITLPYGMTNTMMLMKIRGFEYDTDASWELLVGGYSYNGAGSWTNEFAVITSGNPPFNRVRFGNDTSNAYIVLGTVAGDGAATDFDYPHIYVSELALGYGAVTSSWNEGWTMELITDTTGLSFSGDEQAIESWNANNDGTGSGLDADTIDGVDSAVICRTDGTNCPAAGSISNAAGWTNTSTVIYTTDNNDNVSIGAASPAGNKLYVSGNIKATSSIDTDTQFLGQASDTLSAPSFSWSTDTNMGLYRNTTDVMGIVTAGVERIRIDSDGSVQIGTGTINTATGAGDLYVQGDIEVDGNAAVAGTLSAGATTVTTLDTGQGANELYDMDQNVLTTSAVTFATVNTGQGANELYAMNQNVTTTSTPTFSTVTATTFTGALSGNAATASALAADPADCGANTWATAIGANGALTCTAIAYTGITATTSANWATRVSDETGTGVMAFATSPTFTTGINIEATTTDHAISNDASNDLVIDAGTGGDVIIKIG